MSRQYRTGGGHYGQRNDGATRGGQEPPADLENQFIMRLPAEPAAALKEALRSGAGNLKDRLAIQMEPDKNSANQNQMRRGTVTFDGWTMHSKLVDLPTIIESQKTMDRKTFYKTADICQLLICKEGEPSEDEEDPAEKAEKAKNSAAFTSHSHFYQAAEG